MGLEYQDKDILNYHMYSAAASTVIGLVARMWHGERFVVQSLSSEVNKSGTEVRAWVQQGALYLSGMPAAGTDRRIRDSICDFNISYSCIITRICLSSMNACPMFTAEDWCCASSLIQICENLSTYPPPVWVLFKFKLNVVNSFINSKCQTFSGCTPQIWVFAPFFCFVCHWKLNILGQTK